MNLILRIMLYSKPDGVSFSMSWKITLIQVWLLFCLILLEKLIFPSYRCCFEHEFRFVCVFFFLNPKTTYLCSCDYFSINRLALFLFQHSDYFLKITTCEFRVNTVRIFLVKLLLAWHWTTDDKFAKLYEVKEKWGG